MACPLGIRINRILLYSPLLLSTQSAQENAEHLTFIVVVIKPASENVLLAAIDWS